MQSVHIILPMKENLVFISYSSKNKTVADAVCHILEENGIPCWIAPRNVVPGEGFGGNIVKAIRHCSLMVLIYSADSNRSEHVANEVDRAFSANKTIIPFAMDDTPMNDDFDYYLSRKHWLIAYPDYKEKLQPLVDAVARNLGIDLNRGAGIDLNGETGIAAAEHRATDTGISGQTGASGDRYGRQYENARKALLEYDMETAFSELLDPALDGDEQARSLMARITQYRSRLWLVDKMYFRKIKNAADAGNAYAQYLAGQFYRYRELDDAEGFRYMEMSAAQDCSYGLVQLAEFYAVGDYVEADAEKVYELLSRAVDTGNVWAKFALAKEYLYAWTLKRNVNKGMILLEQCMEAGIPASFSCMGFMCEDGIGTSSDLEKAKEYYRKAIECGFPESYKDLAYLYLWDMKKNEELPEESVRQGISYLRKGAEAGVSNCIAMLAMCYETGLGVPAMPEQAYLWYKKAAQLGDRSAMHSVGNMHYFGKGCLQDYALAWEWFEKGAAMNYNVSYEMLGKMCLQNEAPEGRKQSDCIGYYEAAARLGGYAGMTSAKRLYDIFRSRELERDPLLVYPVDVYEEYDWAPKDDRKALGYLKTAASQDTSGESQFIYGTLLCDSGSVFMDIFEGLKYLKEAAEKGMLRACVKLAELHIEGVWVDKDDRLAEDYLTQAVERGSVDAAFELGMLKARQADKMIEAKDSDEKIKPLVDEACALFEKSKDTNLWDKDIFLLLFDFESYVSREKLKSLFDLIVRKRADDGCVQAMVDCGVFAYMAVFGGEKDLEKCRSWWEKAARLGFNPGIVDLAQLCQGDIQGERVTDASFVDIPEAAYWYSFAEGGIKERNRLLESGRAYVQDYELNGQIPASPDYLKWVFLNRNDALFTPENTLQVFSLNSGTPAGAMSEGSPMPENLNNLFRTMTNLQLYKIKGSGYLPYDVPDLEEKDMYPYLSFGKMHELQQFCADTWLFIKRKAVGILPGIADLTFMACDAKKLTDFMETQSNDEDFTRTMTALVLLRCTLDFIWSGYAPLLALNTPEGDGGFVYRYRNRVPREFLDRTAQMFETGTAVLFPDHKIAMDLRCRQGYRFKE